MTESWVGSPSEEGEACPGGKPGQALEEEEQEGRDGESFAAPPFLLRFILI